MIKQNEEITLKGLLDIILPKIWIIAIVAVLFAVLFGGYSKFVKEDTYTSTCSYYMYKIPTKYAGDNATLTTGINANEIEAMQHLIKDSEIALKSNKFLVPVREKLVAIDEKYEAVTISHLKKMITVSIVGESTYFNVSAVSEDAELSYYVTSVLNELFPEFIKEFLKSYSIEIQEMDPPVKAISPNGKGIAKYVIIGFVGGAFLALLVVFIITKLDVVIRTKEKIESNFDIPVIGVIPHFENEE